MGELDIVELGRRSGLPSSTRQALAVVPPMSNDIRWESPSRPAKYVAASAPAAGPLSIMRTGLRPATSVPMIPPELSMISGWFLKPSVRSRSANVRR